MAEHEADPRDCCERCGGAKRHRAPCMTAEQTSSEGGKGCVDLCASCRSPVKTFANLKVVGDEKHLRATWMPPGGCTCLSLSVDPACPRCFPSRLICQPCGEVAS